MKTEKLLGQWVWVPAGSPMLFRSTGDETSTVHHDRIVRVERIEPPTATRPALAIWADAEGEYGVEARLVYRDALSLLPAAVNSAIAATARAIDRRINARRRR